MAGGRTLIKKQRFNTGGYLQKGITDRTNRFLSLIPIKAKSLRGQNVCARLAGIYLISLMICDIFNMGAYRTVFDIRQTLYYALFMGSS